MAVQALWYGKAIGNLLGGETAGETRAVDILSDTIKVALLVNTYTFDQHNHKFYSDISANEVASGGGYTTGGATLGSKTWVYSSALKLWTFDAADATWAASTITARYGVVYDDTPVGAGNKILLTIVDFGQDQSTAGGTFTIQWASAGIFTISVG